MEAAVMNSLPSAGSSRAVVSLILAKVVDHLGSLPRNSVDSLTDQLDMTLIVLTGPYNLKPNK